MTKCNQILDQDILATHRDTWGSWPQPIREAWEAWLLGKSQPHPNRTAPPRRAKSATNYAREFNYAVAFVLGDLTDVPGCPRDKVRFVSMWTPQLVRELVTAMHAHDYSASTVGMWLNAIERVLNAVAPDFDRDHIKRTVKKKIPRKADQSDMRLRLQDTASLVELGFMMMKAALDCIVVNVSTAIMFRRGLIIAVMALRPYRLSIFASLDYLEDEHEIALHQGNFVAKGPDGRYFKCKESPIDLPRSQDQRRSPFGGGKRVPKLLEMPDEVVEAFEIYIKTYRRVLIPDVRNRALWGSELGGRLSPLMIFKDVAAATSAEFGNSVSPQLFRVSHAFTERRNSQAHRSGSFRILGHTPSVSERNYLPPDLEMTVAVGLENDEVFDSLLGDCAFKLKSKG